MIDHIRYLLMLTSSQPAAVDSNSLDLSPRHHQGKTTAGKGGKKGGAAAGAAANATAAAAAATAANCARDLEARHHQVRFPPINTPTADYVWSAFLTLEILQGKTTGSTAAAAAGCNAAAAARSVELFERDELVEREPHHQVRLIPRKRKISHIMLFLIFELFFRAKPPPVLLRRPELILPLARRPRPPRPTPRGRSRRLRLWRGTTKERRRQTTTLERRPLLLMLLLLLRVLRVDRRA